jgi:hypothetical protein
MSTLLIFGAVAVSVAFAVGAYLDHKYSAKIAKDAEAVKAEVEAAKARVGAVEAAAKKVVP